jgi:VCBS repeat-containing protein
VDYSTQAPSGNAPVAGDDAGTVAEGGTLNVPAPGVLANDTDTDGDELTVTTSPVTAPTHGSLTLNADGSYSYTHDGGETTSDSFVYEVCDAGPLCDTATVDLTITPVNDPPTAADDAGTLTTGATLTVPAPGVMTNDSDPDGDELTVTTTPVTPPSHGDLTLNADGSYSYAHDGGPTTSDSFVYEVCDAGPLCDTATVQLTIAEANDPPSAVNDTGTLAEGGILSQVAPGVLSNDSDPDGDALTVTTTPVTAPSHGSLTLNADGSYSYTHDGSETTSDAFVYEVCDAGPLCATATVDLTIAPVNDPPIVVDDAGSLSDGGTLNVDAPGVLGNDSDPEGGELTVNTTPIAGPSFGTLTLNADGSYSYTHSGPGTSDSFTYEACDPGALCATATVNLVITGGVSVQTPTYSTSGGKNSDRHLDVTVTLLDSAGNPVAGASVSATIQGPTPGGGTATTDAAGTVSFRITNAAPGTYTTVVTSVTAEGLTWDGITPDNSYTK